MAPGRGSGVARRTRGGGGDLGRPPPPRSRRPPGAAGPPGRGGARHTPPSPAAPGVASSRGGRLPRCEGLGPERTLGAVPTAGSAAAANAGGFCLLDDVPPGVHDVVLFTTTGTSARLAVTVAPGRTTIVDFNRTAPHAGGGA